MCESHIKPFSNQGMIAVSDSVYAFNASIAVPGQAGEVSVRR